MSGSFIGDDGTLESFPSFDHLGTFREYEVLNPVQTGLGAEALAALFQQDLPRKTKAFSHPRFEADSEDFFDQHAPIFGQALAIDPEHFPEPRPSGSGRVRQHCLIARTPTGRIVAMALVTFSFVTAEDADLDTSYQTVEDARRVDFNIDFELAYTCSHSRGKGANGALLSAIARLFLEELEHLQAYCKPLEERTGLKTRVSPLLQSEWASRSGKLAHFNLYEELLVVVDEFRDGNPNSSLELEDMDESGGY